MESETPITNTSSPDDSNPGSCIEDEVIAKLDFIGRDKIIQGDQVQGSKIAGDVIIAQIGEQAQNVIVGKNINITNAPRKPLERPPRAAHFKNRENDLAHLQDSLQPGRVITLCGPGGIGKTALAAEVIWRLAPTDQLPDRFPDGVLFHSFYHQPQAALALEKIARNFGEEPRPTPAAAAQRALAGRQVLLLLDGAEEADDLPAILSLCDRCAVLVTSRRRKDAVDERQDVAPLPPTAAIALLKAWGGTRATDESAVRRLSELVGRLPLALRLIGRYLAENEENAFDYLTWLEATPLAALDQGQRQLDSVPLLLTRSLAQVSEQAKQSLAVVGLLALAPFTWEVIAAGLNVVGREIRHALGELVNYGLLVRYEDSYEVTHALIHTYTRQWLRPTPETARQLANYFANFIQTHQSDFAQLNLLRPHIRTLLPICVKQAAWQEVNTLALVIKEYLDLQGHWVDRVTILEAGLVATQALQDRQGTANHLKDLGTAYYALGQLKRAIDYHQQALAIAKETGERKNQGSILGNLGNAYYALGQMEQAIEYYQQALAIAKETGDRKNQGAALGALGGVYRKLGRVEQGIDYHQQALTIAKEIGDRRNECAALGNLGNAYGDLGKMDQAIHYHQQALAIAKEIGDRARIRVWLSNLGLAYAELGQVEQAIEAYQQALAIAKEIGERLGEGIDLGNLGHVYHSLGQVEQAIDHYQQALAIAKETGDRKNEGEWLGNLGIVYYSLEQVEQAIDHYQQALTITQATGDRKNEGVWLSHLGRAYSSMGQVEQALIWNEQALLITRETRFPWGEGKVLQNLGHIYHGLGRMEQTQQVWEEALQIFEQIKSPNAAIVHKLLKSLKSG